MKRRGKLFIAALVASATILFFTTATSGSPKNTRRISDVFNLKQPANVMAVLPDLSGFMRELRAGDAMRAFFDSPLGLHFLRSAPLRSAAHLHRLISLAPRSWQWNLYSLITDGPVYYRSQGKQFALVIALNNKGKVITSLLSDANAAKLDDWLVIASDKQTLSDQLAYLRQPNSENTPLDAGIAKTNSLSIWFNRSEAAVKKPSLTRALAEQFFATATAGYCIIFVSPASNSVGIEGECPQKPAPVAAWVPEKVTLANFPAYAYFRKAGNRLAHVLAFSGFTADYGYLIPRIYYSGPVTDQKDLEFLGQAFKTKSHVLDSKDGALQIRYPHPYSYRETKFDLFSPHLVANRERFFWHSYITAEKTANTELTIPTDYQSYLSIKLHPLIRNSEAAIRQFDALYSPGHFNEFRDALFKSLPTLKHTSLSLYTTHSSSALKIGGALSFAEK